MTTKRYATINDLAFTVHELLFSNADPPVDRDQVRDSLQAHRSWWNHYGDIDDDVMERLLRLVWTDLTDGAAYPF